MSTASLEEQATNESATTTRLRSYESVQDHVPAQQASRWIKPSPIWMLALVAVGSISTSGTVAPRVEIYSQTICHAHSVTPAVCRSDPAMQAASAKLMAVVGTAFGLLSMATAAWWGSLSDCYGRIRVLGFNVVGLMVSDIVFLAVAYFWEKLPGTYWWFVLGPIIEGLVGGISVASIVMHAYISDCSDPTARSRAFSQLMGLLFVGMSIGPLLSGYIMRTTGRVLPVFYATATIDVIVSFSVWFIMPESLSPAEMQKRRAIRSQQLQATGPGLLGVLKRVGSALDVVSPLSVLLPRKVEHVGGKRTMDWTMTVLGAAYGFGTFIQGSTIQQIQYSYVAFGWTADVVSYWLGTIHIAKAVYLTLLFPGIVRIISWTCTPHQLLEPGSEPLLSDELESRRGSSKKSGPSVDLALARLAVVMDLIFYALVFSTQSGLLFGVFTVGVSLGTSFGPTAQSLALALDALRGGTDTGALLGALTVVSSLSSHIIGPALFGIVYANTVATLPGAFFLLMCAALGASLLLLMFVRLRKVVGHHDSEENDSETVHGSVH